MHGSISSWYTDWYQYYPEGYVPGCSPPHVWACYDNATSPFLEKALETLEFASFLTLHFVALFQKR
jgi:hypothetical protein